MPIPLGVLAAAGAGAAGGGAAYELIQTTLITGDTTSVTFSSIPQSFRHLQIRIVARGATTLTGTGVRRIALRFNSDSTNSHSEHELFGNGGGIFSQAAASQSYMWGGYSIDDGVTTNVYSASVLDILDYALNTKNKTTRTLAGNHGGTNVINLQSSARYNLDAISSIQLFAEGAPTHGFRSGSRFSLYGIRG
jgi:hypothetical protein